MLGFARRAPQPRKDYSSCSGCGLCLLVCPVWRRSHDLGLSPLGRARALQHGAAAVDIAASIQSCTLCAACEPACPEEIDLVAMTLELRRQLPHPAPMQDVLSRMNEQAARPLAPRPQPPAMLLAGRALRARSSTLARVATLLGGVGGIALAEDDGSDIALALERGVAIPVPRLERFLHPLRGLKRIVVADGLLLRQLREWLPQPRITSLGEALSGLDAVRHALRKSDLYVIEPRAYHADYQRLVGYYDALRSASGCTFNLDLQRIAIPVTARAMPQTPAGEVGAGDDSVHVRWILQGRNVARIVVESVEDGTAFESAGALPVVHLADLAEDGISPQ